MPTIQEQFSDFLKEWRGERSQETVAEILGLTRSVYSSMENGTRVPRCSTMQAVIDTIRADATLTIVVRPKKRIRRKTA